MALSPKNKRRSKNRARHWQTAMPKIPTIAVFSIIKLALAAAFAVAVIACCVFLLLQLHRSDFLPTLVRVIVEIMCLIVAAASIPLLKAYYATVMEDSSTSTEADITENKTTRTDTTDV